MEMIAPPSTPSEPIQIKDADRLLLSTFVFPRTLDDSLLLSPSEWECILGESAIHRATTLLRHGYLEPCNVGLQAAHILTKENIQTVLKSLSLPHIGNKQELILRLLIGNPEKLREACRTASVYQCAKKALDELESRTEPSSEAVGPSAITSTPELAPNADFQLDSTERGHAAAPTQPTGLVHRNAANASSENRRDKAKRLIRFWAAAIGTGVAGNFAYDLLKNLAAYEKAITGDRRLPLYIPDGSELSSATFNNWLNFSEIEEQASRWRGELLEFDNNIERICAGKSKAKAQIIRLVGSFLLLILLLNFVRRLALSSFETLAEDGAWDRELEKALTSLPKRKRDIEAFASSMSLETFPRWKDDKEAIAARILRRYTAIIKTVRTEDTMAWGVTRDAQRDKIFNLILDTAEPVFKCLDRSSCQMLERVLSEAIREVEQLGSQIE